MTITVSHHSTCPVSQPNFTLPTLPDGQVDMQAPSQCTCDFMRELLAVMSIEVDNSNDLT